jgi:hypothetical protein
MNGLLPTPTAMDSTNATATMKSSQVKEGSMHSVTLCRAMAMGMLPTPTLQDARIGPNNIGGSQHRMERGSVALADIALGLTGMLPTPRANQVNGCDLNSESLANRNKGNLEEHIAKWVTMLPTPTTSLTKHSDKEAYWKNRKDKGRQQDLAMVVHNQVGYNSQLNPQFVLEMMGFPPDWTELPFLNGETNPSKPEETP